MTRAEILAVVTLLYAGDGEENEDIALVDRLRQEPPHPRISDLIFYDLRDLTPEQVVDEPLQRQAAHRG